MRGTNPGAPAAVRRGLISLRRQLLEAPEPPAVRELLTAWLMKLWRKGRDVHSAQARLVAQSLPKIAKALAARSAPPAKTVVPFHCRESVDFALDGTTPTAMAPTTWSKKRCADKRLWQRTLGDGAIALSCLTLSLFASPPLLRSPTIYLPCVIPPEHWSGEGGEAQRRGSW